MNYIISSIVLLTILLIIIYILSIDNNLDKFKNKIKEFITVFKSKKINYLNEKDNINLLNYIKQHFSSNDNVIIPNKIYYNKTDVGYEMNDINIIIYKYNNNNFIEESYIINILFVPYKKEHYISNQTLFGLNGNYKMTILNDNLDNNTEIFSRIPDIIHLSEHESENNLENNIENNSENNTTDTAEIIANKITFS
jgi:hypothetical protein